MLIAGLSIDDVEIFLLLVLLRRLILVLLGSVGLALREVGID